MSDPGAPAGDSLVGTVLEGTYRIERLIAKGGMGAVYEAFHLRLDKRIAVKVMAPELAASAEAVARFHREAMVTSGIGHPNIVHVFDHSITPDGEPFLALEYLDGEDLDQRIQRVGRLSPAATVNIVKQVASALAAAHAKGVVHRDLKPANICLLAVADGPDFVKVLDFGISKVRSSTTKLTKATMVMGTPDYMSPEQALGKVDEIDHRSDQWALACIAWECLGGRGPFRGDDVPSLLYQIVHEAPQPLGASVPDLLPGIERVLRRALSKSRDDRFRSVSDFAHALEDALGGRDSAVTPPPRIVPPTVLLPDAAGAGHPAPTQRLPTTFSQGSGELGEPVPLPPRSRAPWLWVTGAVLLLLAGGFFYRLRQGQVHATAGSPRAAPQADALAAGSDTAESSSGAAPSVKPAGVSIQVVYSTEGKVWMEAVSAEFTKSHPSARVELMEQRSIESVAAILDGSVKPVVWIPADSLVLTLLESEWRAKHNTELFVSQGDDRPQPLLLTPLVFVVWEDREAGLEKSTHGNITWKTLRKAITSPKGWAATGGKSAWGQLKLGMTDPTMSNSGLQALYLMMLEATGKPRLVAQDITRSSVREFVRGVKNGVPRFELSSRLILTDMIRFGPSKYDVSVVYEAAVLSEFENAEGRGAKLKVCYPTPTVWSDHPAALLAAPWVSEAQRQMAREYIAYLRSEPAQREALTYGFRPADTSVKITAAERENPFTRHANSGIAIQAPSAVEMPAGPVVRKLMQMWANLVQ
jgi:serine/threonine protein kinase